MYQNEAKSGFQSGTRISYGVYVVDNEKRRRMMAPIEIEKRKPKKSVISKWRKLTPEQANRRLMSEVRVRHYVNNRGFGHTPVIENPQTDVIKVYTSHLEGLKMTFRLVDTKEKSSFKRKRDEDEVELHASFKQSQLNNPLLKKHKQLINTSSPLNTPLPKKINCN